jgi:hypothetical protein
VSIVVALAVVFLSQERSDCQVWNQKVEPETIQAEIRTRGLWPIYQELTCDLKVWNRIVAGVEDGGAAWLGVVLVLTKKAEGGPLFFLNCALSDLLARNPRQVLSLIDRSKTSALSDDYALQEEYICGNYQSLRTRKAADDLLKAQADGVLAVTEPSLREIRRGCLKAIAEARKTVTTASFEK